MVQGWLRDVSLYKNQLADDQLQNFYRWLGNRSSLFYDPALYRTLQVMTKKLFLQVMALVFSFDVVNLCAVSFLMFDIFISSVPCGNMDVIFENFFLGPNFWLFYHNFLLVTS